MRRLNNFLRCGRWLLLAVGLLLPLGMILLSGLGAAAQAPSGRVELLLAQGQQALEARNFPAAEKSFEEARRLAPSNPEAWRGLLQAYLQARRPADAVNIGNQAVERWPDDAGFHHWLGLACFQTGAQEQATQHLQRAEQLAPADYDILFDSALVYLETRQYAPAATQLEKALKLRRNVALAHLLLGRAYQNSNRTLPAVDEFKEALRLDPNIPLGHYHLGFAYESLGRSAEAIAEFKKELARNPLHPEVLFRLGHAMVDAGQYSAAMPHLEHAIQYGPQNAEAWYDLGKAQLALRMIPDAMVALERATELKPDDPTFFYQLARGYQMMGNKEKADKAMQRFAELKRNQKVTGGMAHKPN